MASYVLDLDGFEVEWSAQEEKEEDEKEKCEECGGDGEVDLTIRAPRVVTCKACEGTGYDT